MNFKLSNHNADACAKQLFEYLCSVYGKKSSPPSRSADITKNPIWKSTSSRKKPDISPQSAGWISSPTASGRSSKGLKNGTPSAE